MKAHDVADSGITLLSDPEDAVIDIVFVHGLQGHPKNTWTYDLIASDRSEDGTLHPPPKTKRNKSPIPSLRKLLGSKKTTSQPTVIDTEYIDQKGDVEIEAHEIFWPRDFLAHDFPKARIMTYGYDTFITRGFQAVDQSGILDHARKLLYSLMAERAKAKERHLVLIAHSLGGILIKDVLRRSATSLDPTVRKIAASTTGTFFFGTPHRGSKKWASEGEGLALIASYLLGIDVNTKIIHSLLPTASELETCRESFADLWDLKGSQLMVRTFQESRALTGIRFGGFNELIVPKDSSDLDRTSQRATPLDGDHRTMVKFNSRDHLGYKLVKGDLEELLAKAEDVDEDDITDSFPSHEKRACLQSLRTTDYEQFKDRNPERLDETGEWFLKHENYLKWKQNKSSSLLWLSADPGCGKSVLAKFLVDSELKRGVSQDRTVCHFFFRDDNENQSNIPMALAAILHQLFEQKENLIKHAMKDYRAEGEKLAGLFQKLWNILIQAASDNVAGEVICILDGLDECAPAGREKIINALRKFYEQALKTDKGPRLKFLVTSRPYFDIVQQFEELMQEYPKIRLQGENESTAISNEIDMFIKWEVAKLATRRRLNGNEKELLETSLLSMEHRTYLWATLVIDHLHKTIRMTSKKIQDIVTKLPSTVEHAYEAMLSRIEDEDLPQARKLLAIVLAANRPLTLSELNEALTIEISHQSYEELNDDLEPVERFGSSVRDMCGLFVSVISNRVYMIHQTAREFLISETQVRNEGWKHSFKPVQCELVIATSCICLIGLIEREKDFKMAPDSKGNNLDYGLDFVSYKFIAYASRNWTTHFRKAQVEAKPELLQEVLSICRTSSESFKQWSRLYGLSQVTGFPSTLMIASYFGHDVIAKELMMTTEVNINEKDSKYKRTSFSWAVQQNHFEIVRRFLKTGQVEVDAKDKDGNTALWIACSARQEDMALLILDHGADPNQKNLQIESPLMKSASQALPGVLNRMLKSLSPSQLEKITEDLKPGKNSILNAAIVSEHGPQTSIVKMVVDALQSFPTQRRRLLNHPGEFNCSPMFHAARENSAEVIKLLAKLEPELLIQRGWGDWKDTPLHVATHWQNPAAVRALVECGADPNIQQRVGQTPLYIATHRPESPRGKEILKILIGCTDALISDDQGSNIVHNCLHSNSAGHYKTIAETVPREILHQLLTSKNKKGNIPLFEATTKFRRVDEEYSSRSKVFKAVCQNFIEAVQDMETVAIMNLMDEKDRNSILHRFIETSSDDLTVAVLGKLLESNKSLLDLADGQNKTPLMKAADRKMLGTINVLIAQAANVDSQDELGKTALHHAVERDIPNIAQILVDSGAKLTIQDKFHRIPFEWCSSRNKCRAIVEPKDTADLPIRTQSPQSMKSNREEWVMTLGAKKEDGFWRVDGDRGWFSNQVPIAVHRDRYLISDPIPDNTKLPVARLHVEIEGRDQGYSDDRWFSHLPEGSFTSCSWYELIILRGNEVVLRREWARNPHRSKTPHKFQCSWSSNSEDNRDVADFGGRKPASEDDQGDFVRRLTVGDRVAIVSRADGVGWMGVTKSALIEIHFDG
ncbi:ankyrin [Corynespora cassiicola Philippines]|uniref:Ankyrin n=1 Tax=Corynespora cassiicola Philippines TaxID=1448308 RepID=A0A2T2NVI3_CORCC|nr:ankyrin [Corynespora cassiicola Philippines]